jgi:uncharacterized protein YciI
MQYVLECRDAADALPRRMQVRQAHLEWVAATTEVRVMAAGPLLDDAGGFVGSLFIIEATDRAAVEAWHERDPYVANRVFERVTLTPFRWTFNPPPA